MKPIPQFLSEEEIGLIHHSAIKILKEIGFRFPFDHALDLLKKAGADVVEGNVARIPENLAEIDTIVRGAQEGSLDQT